MIEEFLKDREKVTAHVVARARLLQRHQRYTGSFADPVGEIAYYSPGEEVKGRWRQVQIPGVLMTEGSIPTGSYLTSALIVWGAEATAIPIAAYTGTIVSAAGGYSAQLPHELLAESQTILGLTFVELGRILGVSRQTIHKWLSSQASPREGQVDRIARLEKLAQGWKRLSGGKVLPRWLLTKTPTGQLVSLLDSLIEGVQNGKDVSLALQNALNALNRINAKSRAPQGLAPIQPTGFQIFGAALKRLQSDDP